MTLLSPAISLSVSVSRPFIRKHKSRHLIKQMKMAINLKFKT